MPDAGATSRSQAFLRGCAAPWQGWRLMAKHPGLWKYGLIPAALNLVITLLALALLVLVGAVFVYRLHPWFQQKSWGWLWELIAGGAWLVLSVVLVVGLWKVLQTLLCSVFYARLATAAEIRLGLDPGEFTGVPWTAQMADMLHDARHVLAAAVICLLLNCVPVIGTLIVVPLAFFLGVITTGKELIGYPLGVRSRRREDVLAFVDRNFWDVVGLGTAGLVLGLVPIIGAVFVTTAVVGAVLLHRNLDETAGLQTAGRSPRPISAPEMEKFEG